MLFKKKNDVKTKILIIDIENSPSLGWVWAKYETDVVEFKEDWYMLSFSAKWLGEKKVTTYGLPDFKLFKTKGESRNDIELVRKLRDLLDEADIVIGHNVDRFDIRKLNARCLVNGILPPSPYKTIDTLKIARKYFKFDDNKLSALARQLGIGSKLDTGGFALWRGCMEGDAKSWKKMLQYNEQDVILTEKVYNLLRPWVAGHHNINVLSGRTEACPTCGSKHLQSRGYSITKISKRPRFQCQECGSWSTGKPIKTDIVIR